MRNILAAFFLAFITISAFSQKSDTTSADKEKLDYYIELCTDKMTDKEYAFGSKSLMCSEDGKKGFLVSISWDNKSGKITYSGITVVSAGIGTCNQNDELIFLFEDDTKFSFRSWNDFNCEGRSYFDLKHKSFDEFNTKKVKALRFTNGRSYDSYTYNILPKEQSFFIEAKNAFDNKRFVIGKCQ